MLKITYHHFYVDVGKDIQHALLSLIRNLKQLLDRKGYGGLF